MKIDTQGAEYKIISGMEEIISKYRDDIKVVVEFWPDGLDLAKDSAEKMLSLMGGLFVKFLVIDEENETLFELALDDLSKMSAEALRKNHKSKQINLLCFGSFQTFEKFASGDTQKHE